MCIRDRNLAANIIAKDADLVIGVGTRYTDFTTSSKAQFQNSDVKFLNINVSRFHAYKLDATQVVADAKLALDELTEILAKENYRSGYTDQIKDAKAQWDKELDRLFNIEYKEEGFKPEVPGYDEVIPEFYEKTGSCLAQTRVLGELDRLLPPDAIIVGASGSLPGDLQRVWSCLLYTSSNYQCS